MDVLKINEAVPESYPAVDGLTPQAAALDPAIIWQRIEAYIAWRWTPRSVIWTVEGGGDFQPPLSPVSIDATYRWSGNTWVRFEAEFGPLGFMLPEELCKIEATAGFAEDGQTLQPPAVVLEAFRRLAEYSADDPGKAGASSEAQKIDVIEEEFQRSPTWLARAMQNSGAGDLLRPYRRA